MWGHQGRQLWSLGGGGPAPASLLQGEGLSPHHTCLVPPVCSWGWGGGPGDGIGKTGQEKSYWEWGEHSPVVGAAQGGLSPALGVRAEESKAMGAGT